jgi:hypothetical protein
MYPPESDHPFASMLAYMILLPWAVPHAVAEGGSGPEAFARRCLTSYAAQPFEGGPGILRDGCTPALEGRKPVKFALAAESGYQLQQVVPVSVSARLLLPLRLDLDLRVDGLQEVAPHDHTRALMGTAHLNFRFAQSKHVDMRTGIGPRLFQLDASRWGLDIFYALDIYGTRPFVSRIELHAGSLGGALAGQVRATLGWMFGPTEVYAGYDHTHVSDRHGPGTSLGGPIAGVRLWF